MRLVRALPFVFLGCSGALPIELPVTEVTVADAGASTEVVVDAGLITTPADAGTACEGIEFAQPAPRQTCTGRALVIGAAGTELAPRGRGVETYGAESVVANADSVGPSGADVANAPWVNGDDVTVGFRAPKGGRWRLTASGIGAHRLQVQRSCTSVPAENWERAFSKPSDSWIETGPELTNEVFVELNAERDEQFDVVVDGCPRGSRCSYSIRAERLGALACDAANPCASTDECFIDRCDAERYACIPRARLEAITPATTSAWVDRYGTAVGGRVANWPKGLPPLRRSIRYELLDRAGSPLPSGNYPAATITDGWFPSTVLDSNAAVSAVRISFSTNEYARVAPGAPIIAIGSRGTRPVALGARCEPGNDLEPCMAGVCRRNGPYARVCTLSTPRIDQARGFSQTYNDPNGSVSGPAVFIELEGEAVPMTWATTTLLDGNDRELTAASTYCDYSELAEATGTRIDCRVQVTASVLGQIAKVRLSTEKDGVTVTRVVPVQPVPTVGFGEACGVRGRSVSLLGMVGTCAEGLRCSGAGRTCALDTEEFLCTGGAASKWAPATLPSSISGATSGAQYSRSCGGPSGLRTELAFIAPQSGSYVFTITGSATATFERTCLTQPCSQPGDLTASPVPLTSGERVLVRVQAVPTTPTFSISVRASQR